MNEEIKEIKNKLKQEDEQEDKLKKTKCSNCGKINVYQHKHRPLVCPVCSDEFWNKPKDEYLLFHLQKKYLTTRDNIYLGKIYSILKEYAKKLIINTVKNKYFFKKEDLEIKAHDSAVKIITYYMEKPEFKIETSFGGYLNWPIKNVLYGNKQEEGNDSLNSMIDQENELEDYLPNISDEVRKKMVVCFEDNLINNNSIILEELLKIITKMKNIVNRNFSKKHVLLFLVGLIHKFNGQSNNFMDDFYLYSGLEVKTNVEKAMFYIYKFLKTNC